MAQYDRRVNVHFQENAWCDESVTTYFAHHCWKPHVEAPTLLILDEHKAQETDALMDIYRLECRTTPVLVPDECTSLVQPLDIVFNAPFKSKINAFATQHLQEHLNEYLHGKFTAGERRVLFTKWIREVWAEMSSKSFNEHLENVESL